MAVMAPDAFLSALRARGFDFLTGVPCSLVKDLLAHVEVQTEVPYVHATREDIALGLAAGAAMAGRRPVVVMQNSGLGLSINALLSLHRIYRIPCLLLITWRGYEGVDAPEHVIMGPALPTMLDVIGVPHRTLDPKSDVGTPESLLAALDWADATLREGQEPVALLVRKGAL